MKKKLGVNKQSKEVKIIKAVQKMIDKGEYRKCIKYIK
jgi:hypothetical protein